MFRKSSSEQTTADPDAPYRRGGRGWGPFSGRQLTIIIVAVVVIVGLPVGAFAVVSGSNSFITDTVSGAHATVDGAGQVLAAQAPPNSAVVHALGFGVTDTVRYAEIFTPGTKAVVLTEIDFNQQALTSSAATLYLFTAGHNACSTTGSVGTNNVAILTFRSPAPGNLQIPLAFPSGVSIRAGHALCAYLATWNGTSTNVDVDANINGHYIPAAACTTVGSTCG